MQAHRPGFLWIAVYPIMTEVADPSDVLLVRRGSSLALPSQFVGMVDLAAADAGDSGFADAFGSIDHGQLAGAARSLESPLLGADAWEMGVVAQAGLVGEREAA